jgi:dihydrofolate synthase / folylpolyglutamate synthase
MHPGPGRMTALLDSMGNPHRAFPSVHVAGTNGKGSTSSMIAAVCTSAGIRTGLHTSPHLLYTGERMRVDGKSADRDWLAHAVTRFRSAMTILQVSFFEATTALSFLFFSEQTIDLAVVEVGLGGRLDATNVLDPIVSVITGISLDHTDILGSTLQDIAREKAGIIKPGVSVVTGEKNPSVLGVFESVARQQETLRQETRLVSLPGGSFVNHLGFVCTDDSSPLDIELRGIHQIRNAAVAVRVVEEAAIIDSDHDLRSAVIDGLRNTGRYSGLRARMEELTSSPVLLLDVAHNPESVRSSIDTALASYNRLDQIFLGLYRDKDMSGIGEVLSRAGVEVVTFSIDGERGMESGALAAELRRFGVRAHAGPAPLSTCLESFVSEKDGNRVTLVTGSHMIASETMEWAERMNNNPNIHSSRQT